MCSRASCELFNFNVAAFNIVVVVFVCLFYLGKKKRKAKRRKVDRSTRMRQPTMFSTSCGMCSAKFS